MSAPNLALLRCRLELILARINAPDYRPGRVATVSEFAERWKAEVLSQHKPSSQKAANSHLKCHILPHLGELNLDEVGRERQQVFVTHLSQKQSRKSVMNILGTLPAMMNTAKNWGDTCEGIKQSRLVLTDGGLRSVARFFSAEEARILFLDEPVAGVFPALASQILALLRQLRNEGKVVVFIEHDISAVRQAADHVIVMDEGKIIVQGRPADVLERPEIMEAYLA